MKNARAGKPHAAESENERPQILFKSEKRTFVRRACNNNNNNTESADYCRVSNGRVNHVFVCEKCSPVCGKSGRV